MRKANCYLHRTWPFWRVKVDMLRKTALSHGAELGEERRNLALPTRPVKSLEDARNRVDCNVWPIGFIDWPVKPFVDLEPVSPAAF